MNIIMRFKGVIFARARAVCPNQGMGMGMGGGYADSMFRMTQMLEMNTIMLDQLQERKQSRFLSVIITIIVIITITLLLLLLLLHYC